MALISAVLWLHLDFSFDDWLTLYRKLHIMYVLQEAKAVTSLSSTKLFQCRKPIIKLNIHQKKFTLKAYQSDKS